ncbi:ankyrin repeat-containing domain protein [Piptocephalis cylindrospora]|uniref:Ankyrin repeat-containing domain protein n=1 Tax=Piptocephalis cylindrospora TaxID=1907219 RepID=A0A4P9Y095_9FUNG|nr:ankyrin repeat-containing domain protein [Piptocephalis cylindrospora]|eukprot:RKP11872.1 ankyrin repeat-containing domain protein [Piptocephalis cylindrospora]
MSEELINELVLSARYGDEEDVTRLFQENPALSPAATNTSGQTALHMASANGHLEVGKVLVNRLTPEQLDIQNEGGNTALHWAALNGHLEMVKLLVSTHADPTIKNTAGRTAMYEAQQRGHDAIVDYLLTSYDPPKGSSGDGEDEDDVPEGTVFRAGVTE